MARRRRGRHTESTIREDLEICIRAALAGGRAVIGHRPRRIVRKQDAYVGHHAIVSSADHLSQAAIRKDITSVDPDAWLVFEETAEGRAGSAGRPWADLAHSGAFIVDELDGSSSFATGHHEWSVSVGYLHSLVHRAAAVFAPRVGGGTLFYAAHRNGAFAREARSRATRLRVAAARLRDAYVLFGPDNFLPDYPLHNRLVNLIAGAAQTVNSSGSCALAMALVAAGRANALVQPLQSPWDWAAGRLLVEEAGGAVLFYELSNGRVLPLQRLEVRHYDPAVRAVGFVAGPRDLAGEVLERLDTLARGRSARPVGA